jgi:hypothetical protein
MADDKERNKCEHPSCTCLADPGEDFCSPHCESVLDTDIICGCGHEACQTPAAVSSASADLS